MLKAAEYKGDGYGERKSKIQRYKDTKIQRYNNELYSVNIVEQSINKLIPTRSPRHT